VNELEQLAIPSVVPLRLAPSGCKKNRHMYRWMRSHTARCNGLRGSGAARHGSALAR
jgi:hypothetical protein